MGQLGPMLRAAAANARAAGHRGRIGVVVADAGYWSEANAALDDPAGTRLLIAPNPGRRRTPGSRAPTRPGRERMRRRLRHPANATRLRRRGAIVEPVFGQLKEAIGFRRFARRGLDACAAEWTLLCIGHNLRKLHRQRLRDREITGGRGPGPRPGGRRGGPRGSGRPSRRVTGIRRPLTAATRRHQRHQRRHLAL